MEIKKLKRMLDLKPLPEEGGFYAESYRSNDKFALPCLPERYSGERRAATAIYFLLTPETFSAMHRLASDELYYFYLGGPIELLCLREDGSAEISTIGTDLESGMRPQIVVPHGTWQGSRLRPGGKFALLGTTVAPGFEFVDFELGKREELARRYPKFADRIRDLTR